MEPIIVKDWDSLPPEVVGEGILYSTRILCRQHHEMKARIAELEAQLKEKPFSPDWDRLQACRDSVKEHQQMVRDLRAQLKTAKRDAVLEAVEDLRPQKNLCGTYLYSDEGLIEYANTIGKE